MTNAELERLAILVEEASEVQHIAMKIIRHGYESHNPFDDYKTTNRELLNKELGDLSYIIHKMAEHSDISHEQIKKFHDEKKIKIDRYLHYNLP